MFGEIRESVLALRECPRELWIVYTLILLDGFSYFSLSYCLVLYLSEEFGFDDSEAGWAFGIYGMLISVYGLCLGFVIDMFGVRVTLLLANTCLMFGRLVLCFTAKESVALAMLYVLIPIGQALLQPAMTTGLRRYTTRNTRSMAFSLFYVFLNVGALLAAPVVDLTRFLAPHGGYVPVFGDLSAYQVIIFSGGMATVLSLLLSCLVAEIDVGADGNVVSHTPKGGSPHQIMYEVMQEARFWRFMLLILLLIGVGMIFRHLDATFPKYMVRTHGESVPFGSIISINPFMIIFLVPMLTPITKTRSQFDMILLGSIVTALSVGFMVIGPYIWCAVLFVVVMSVGEALWSPRLYEYSSMVAPKGREGTYMALSSAPNFVAKVFVGGLSGYLFEEYCPSYGNCSGFGLWLIVFLMTLSSPVLMLLLKDIIRQEDAPYSHRDAAGDVSEEEGVDGHADEGGESERLLGGNRTAGTPS